MPWSADRSSFTGRYQRHAAYRLEAGRPPHLELDGPMRDVEDPDVVYFRKIVILGGVPENRHRGMPLAVSHSARRAACSALKMV